MKKRRNKKFSLKVSLKKPSVAPHFINKKVFWTLSFLTISLIAILILQIQLLAQRSELLSRSQKELAELSEKNSRTEEMLSSSGETLGMAQLAQNLNFEKIDKVYYIRAIESTVLAK